VSGGPIWSDRVVGRRVVRLLAAGQSLCVGASDQVQDGQAVGDVTVVDPAPNLVSRQRGVLTDDWLPPPVASEEVFTGSRVETGPWSAIAAALAPALVWVIAQAYGGTGLDPRADYLAEDPTNAGRWHPDAGDLYAQSITAWERAGRKRLDLVVFIQGELDAGLWQDVEITAEDAQASYQQALIDMAEAYHATTGAKVMVCPTSLGQYADQPAYTAMVQPIHDAQIAACVARPNILVQGPLVDDIEHMAEGDAHLKAVAEQGVRIGTAIASYLGLS